MNASKLAYFLVPLLCLSSLLQAHESELESKNEPFEEAQSYETTVESKQAFYNGESITLSGNVIVKNILGTVFSENAVLKKDDKKQTEMDFPWIELSSNVVLALSNGSRLCCERLLIDYIQMTSRFIGEPLVIFSDESYEIYAETASIDYQKIDGTLKPVKIFLEKNVKLFHRGTSEKPESQYALADALAYYPETQSIVMEGKTSRVLFFDSEKNMQLSAKKILASRNPETKKDTIQGVGDVNFTFGAEELEKLKQRFRW